MSTNNWKDLHKKMLLFNKQNQESLDELICTNASINGAEDVLRTKINLICTELETITKDFSNIMDTYSQIISVSSANQEHK